VADSLENKSLEEILQEELCVVYVLYFDEAIGHVPLLIFPIEEEKLKENKRFMRPIKYHPVWFLSAEEQEPLDHIDLEFKGFTFFGKKFLTKSMRKKRRAGLEEDTPETIVTIVSLPNDLALFGDELIHLITDGIKDRFDEKLFKIIEFEVVKDQVIKTPNVKKIIEEGLKIREDLNQFMYEITDNYFSKSIKQADTLSIRQQKALSYLALKGIDVSQIRSTQNGDTFSSMNLFETKEGEVSVDFRAPFKISNISLAEDSKELEIIVLNNTGKEVKNLNINITHVKEFFEKEIMFQEIDLWFPDEELLFISPILPGINEYLFFITEKAKKEKLLSKKIDLKQLKKDKK
jgi:hypothetical protein